MCFSWKSKEQQALTEIRDLVSSIWSETEGVYYSDEAMAKVSKIVNKAVVKIDQETERLIKRDAEVFGKHTCSHCESDKIYVCDPCMDKWAKETENAPIN